MSDTNPCAEVTFDSRDSQVISREGTLAVANALADRLDQAFLDLQAMLAGPHQSKPALTLTDAERVNIQNAAQHLSEARSALTSAFYPYPRT